MVSSDPAVANIAADNWAKIDKPCIYSKKGGGKCVALDSAQGGLHLLHPPYILDCPRDQQVLGHIEHQEGLHAVVGKAFECLGAEQDTKACRMTEEASFSAGNKLPVDWSTHFLLPDGLVGNELFRRATNTLGASRVDVRSRACRERRTASST